MNDYNEETKTVREPTQAPEAPARHRRSDRYKANDAGSQPSGGQAPTPYPFYSQEKPDPAPEFTRRVAALDEAEAYQEDEYDETEGDRPWLKIGLIVLLAILALCAILYFLPDAGPLQPIKKGIENTVQTVLKLEKKEPATALSFQSLSSIGVTGVQIEFQATTNKAVEDVRLTAENGLSINAVSTLVNKEDETNKIWRISASFESPFEGNVALSLKTGEGWIDSGKLLPLRIAKPTTAPTQAPTQPPTEAPTQAPTEAPTQKPTQAPTKEPIAAEENSPDTLPEGKDEDPSEALSSPDENTANSLPVIPTWVPAKTQTETPMPETPTPTQAPTQTPTQAPTQKPTEAPTKAPTPPPTAVSATEVPRLTANEDLRVTVNDTVLVGSKTQKNFNREKGYVAPNPDAYAYYEAGVLTFRGDNFRRNAAFGTAKITEEEMEILWQSSIGSLRTADNGTLYGVGWTGQPAIIKWTKEAREMMNLHEDKRTTAKLREVIFGAQDGKIYFLDLTDGSATRDPINVGYSLKGSVSLDTYGRPLLAIGQGISKLGNGKTGDIGLHVFNLIDGKRAFLLNGRKTKSQLQYCANGAFDGTPLFLYQHDAMIAAGENGLLYTVDLGSTFTYPRAEDPDAKGSMSVNQKITYLRSKAKGQQDTQVGMESSIAMYDKYIYLADTFGLLRCVDSDSMKTVWSFDAGDNTDASIALDMEDSETVSLYTGNTAYSRLGSKKDVSIRKLDALTGNELWSYSIRCDQDKKNQASGCKASPVVGQHSISDLVIFTVNMVKDGGSRVIAFHKEDGSVAWSFDMNENAVSSPVAVYNDAGDAWIIQADQGGTLHMLSGLTGQEKSTLALGGEIQASPAVYKNYLVIGTCSKDNSFMYGIELK